MIYWRDEPGWATLLWASAWTSIGSKPGRARLSAMALIAVLLIGIVTVVWPYIVPFSVTVWDASAPPGSQLLLLSGVAVMLPVVLANFIYVYWLFRQKPVRAGNNS